jgi:hypothetical protein
MLPLAILLPFAAKATDHATVHQTAQGPVLYFNTTGPHPALIIGGWVVIGLLLLLSFFRKTPSERSQRREFIKKQLVVSIASVAVSVLAYYVMRNHSQGESINNYSYDAAAGNFIRTFDPIFGVGVSPSTVLWVTIAYLTVPLVKWYNVFKNKSRVEGFQKKELFQ